MGILEKYKTLYAHLPTDREVTVVAVTKYATLDQMIEAYQAGIRDFGENKVQVLLDKQQTLPPEIVHSVRWHMVGHLQKNKAAKTVGGHVSLIQSLDSEELAQKLSMLNQAQGTCQQVLVQLNMTREPQKTGFDHETLLETFPRLLALPGICVTGLMAMGPHTHNGLESKACFEKVAMVRNALESEFSCQLPQLSMGMTEDYVYGIESGATIIRIGSLLFGSPSES